VNITAWQLVVSSATDGLISSCQLQHFKGQQVLKKIVDEHLALGFFFSKGHFSLQKRTELVDTIHVSWAQKSKYTRML